MDERELYPVTDYWYEVTDEQIREHLARSPLERLKMLDEARRFGIMGRRAMIAAELRGPQSDGEYRGQPIERLIE